MFITISGNVVCAYRATLQKSRAAPDYAPQLATTLTADTVLNHEGQVFSCGMEYEVDPCLYNCVLLGLDFYKLLRIAGLPDSVFESLPVYHAEMRGREASFAEASSCDTQSQPYIYKPLSSGDVNIQHSPEYIEAADVTSQYDGVEGFDYLQDILLRSYSTGVKLSPFTNELVQLQRTLTIHGLNSYGLSIEDCRCVYMFHVMSGDCVEHRVCHGDRTACLILRKGFSDPHDLSYHAFQILADASAICRSTDSLISILKWLRIRTTFMPLNLRRQVQKRFTELSGSFTPPHNLVPNANILYHFEKSSRAYLIMIAHVHRITIDRFTSSTDLLKDTVLAHFLEGGCFAHANSIKNSECVKHKEKLQPAPVSDRSFCLKWLQDHIHDLKDATLIRVFKLLDIPYSDTDRNLPAVLNRWLRAQTSASIRPADDITQNRWREIRESWPINISQAQKDSLVKEFREQTSKDQMRTRVCASCSESVLETEAFNTAGDDIDYRCFLRPDRRPKYWKEAENSADAADPCWLSYNSERPTIESPIVSLPDVLLDKAGVVETSDGVYSLWLCGSCHSAATAQKVPPLSLANHNFLGDAPSALSDLTVIEEVLIAKARAKKIIFHLKEEDTKAKGPSVQRSMKGHTIIYPQRTSNIISVLPPPIEDVFESICILFVGSSKPDPKWVREKAKPLIVRRQKVHDALKWLQQHNPLYANVNIDTNTLMALPDNDALDIHVEYVVPTKSSESLTSRYDDHSDTSHVSDATNDTIPFPTVVIADINPNATAVDLRRVAANHFKNKKPFLEIGHEVEPENEFCNPKLYPSIYPTLFPFGIGGFEEQRRSTALSFQYQCRHLCNLVDSRFQKHPSFMFTAFNTIQRRAMLLHTSLKVKRSSYDRIAQTYADISPEAMHKIADRMSRGEVITQFTDEERSAYNLLKEVNVVTSHVPGSSASKVAMRNEIRAMIIEKGLPTFYITINPSDTHNPLVRFVSGEDIDIDNLANAEPFSQWSQSVLIASNPVVGAKFFHKYMTTFIDTILKYDPTDCNNTGGALGVVKSYFGCVEAQGRGSLHCHMLIWVEGAMNVDQIKERVKDHGDRSFGEGLLRYLDDTISTRIPTEGDASRINDIHPCTHRGPLLQRSESENNIDRQNDLHSLAAKTQRHIHSDTCYKYWKGPLSGEPRLCRFDLDADNIIPESYFDELTADVHLRKLDGLVNNFNDTILRAIRCNMDIKFIGSGPSAKAVIYYITDYITKSQLKTHVAYAALDIAIQKLGEYDADDSTLVERAKRLLQRCAYTMIKHQEMSAQQVASYVLGLPDHFKSHTCQNFYWTSFEHYINLEIPSEECYDEASTHTSPSGNPSPFSTSNLYPEPLSTVSNNEQQPLLVNSNVDDVVLDVSDKNAMGSKASRIQDYIMRSDALRNICLWDFTAQFSKVKGKAKDESTEHVIEDVELSLTSTAHRNQPIYGFRSTHPDASTHHCKLKAAIKRNHTNPLGPSLPRRDNESQYAKYSRLMLIFFKPWRRASDLLSGCASWIDAFTEFSTRVSCRISNIIDNIQLLHECKDSRDDHFASRHQTNHFQSSERDGDAYRDESLNDSELSILEHLVDTDSCQSHHKTALELEAEACVSAATEAGVFDAGTSCDITDFCAPLYTGTDITGEKAVMEQIWKSEYDTRNQASRVQGNNTSVDHEDMYNASRDSNITVAANTSTIPFDTTTNTDSDIHLISNDHTLDCTPALNPDEIARSFQLNDDQMLAYKLVVQHSSANINDNEQLRMYISGPGGTGKSQVINALKSYFDAKKESHRFKLASYTGIAAKNISGVTLHSALMLSHRKRSGMTEKSRRELIKFWEHIDYLFIDEVSMIGCKFMYKISEALCDAKQSDAPFGGINIIFAGDFAQLPPVADTRLYSSVSQNNVGINKGIETVLGKLLWFSVRTHVSLSKVMRQDMSTNSEFVQLLGRLRYGCCSDDDYALLQTKVLSTACETEKDKNWSGIPIVVSKNECKDAMNIEAILSFAKRTNAPVHWYYSHDKWSSDDVNNSELQNYLWDMPSNRTNQRLGKLPLVIGMPVMVTTNFDVSNGIVNGSVGVLKDVRYTVDNDGHRHAKSCVLESDTGSDVTMHSLQPKQVVALEDSTKMQIQHPHSKRKCTITRTQLPVLPAFAMTVHKAQGQSMDSVLADVESCHGTEAPYVMLSRVRDFRNLYILRPFQISKIQSRQSQELRDEFKRQKYLELTTHVVHGSPLQRTSAQALISEYRAHLCHSNISPTRGDDKDGPRLLDEIRRIQVSVASLPDDIPAGAVRPIRKKANLGA